MSAINPDDHIICIDATRLAKKYGHPFYGSDFSFPHGVIEEGNIYRVESVIPGVDGYPALTLIGLPVLIRGKDVGWSSQRFRRVVKRRNQMEQSKQHLLGKPVNILVSRI